MPLVTVQTDQGAKTLNFTKTPTPDVISKAIKQQGWKPKVSAPAPAPAAKPGIFAQVDQAMQKPQVEMNEENTSGGWGNIFPTIGNSIKNSVKDLGSFAYNSVVGTPKAVVQAAQTVPGYVSDTFGAVNSQVGAINLQKKLKAAGGAKSGNTAAQNSQMDISIQVPDFGKAAVETLSTPVVTDLSHGQFKKAIQDVAEKPFTNLLPYALAGTEPSTTGKGYQFRGTGSGGFTGGVADLANKTVETAGGAVTETVKAPFKATAATAKAIVNSYEGTGINNSPAALQAKADASIRMGMQKGVKPTILGKQSMARQSAFYDNAKTTVQTMAENRSKVSIVNPETGEVTNKPQTIGEFAQAIPQMKKMVYDQYSAMSKAAGEAGAQADVSPIVQKLIKTAYTDGQVKISADGTVVVENGKPNVKYSPEMRKYALDMVKEVRELQGADPTILEARIKDLNSSLAGYYEGRTVKAKAQIDASIASMLREQLDTNIEESLNKPGYQELKSKYGAIKSMEKDVNKRAVVLARQNVKSLPETLTDVWSGAELVAGAFGDPTAFVRGAASKGIMAIIKKMNAPDTYISKMFNDAYNAYPEKSPAVNGTVMPPESKGGGPSQSTPSSVLPEVPRPPQLNAGPMRGEGFQAGNSTPRTMPESNQLNSGLKGLLPPASDKIYGDNFSMTNKPIKSSVELSKAINDYKDSVKSYNQKPTPTKLATVRKLQAKVDSLKKTNP